MLNHVTRVTPLANHRLEVEFQDGVYGTIDLSDRLFGEMFEPLRDEAAFREVSIDNFGTICWPNGADLAPDAIHRTLIHRRFPVLAHTRTPPPAISTHDQCLEQLLQAFADLADREDIRQAAERLARVQEWIRHEAALASEDPTSGNVKVANS
jgi:hypothetical protein